MRGSRASACVIAQYANWSFEGTTLTCDIPMRQSMRLAYLYVMLVSLE